MFKIPKSALVVMIVVAAILYWVTYEKDPKAALPETAVNRSTNSAVPFSYWKEFEAHTGKFKVSLPSIPQYAIDTVNIPQSDKKRFYEVYVSENVNGTLFLISLITYPVDVDTSNTDEMLHDVVNELMSSNPKNRLTYLKDSLYQSNPALDFQIDNHELKVQGKTFMIDKTMYVLTYVVRKDDFDSREYQHFIDSFTLLPNANNKKEMSK